MLPKEPEPVVVLDIDEVRRGESRTEFSEKKGSWTLTADRRHVGFRGPSGGQGLLALVEGSLAERQRLPGTT